MTPRTPPAPATYEDAHLAGFQNGYEEGFEIGKAQCETHHQDMKDEAAHQAREDDIMKIQKKLDESKKNLYGFDAKEAEWINGFETGLDAAIESLRGHQ